MDKTTIQPNARGYLIATLAVGASLALLGAGSARANMDLSTLQPAPLSATKAGCASLPVSQRESCMSQVGWSGIPSAQIEIDRAASARTASEMAACKTLPVSDKFMCENQAGYGQKVLRPALSARQETALKAEDARYEANAAACKRGPVSDLNICLSLAGNDATLRSSG